MLKVIVAFAVFVKALFVGSVGNSTDVIIGVAVVSFLTGIVLASGWAVAIAPLSVHIAYLVHMLVSVHGGEYFDSPPVFYFVMMTIPIWLYCGLFAVVGIVVGILFRTVAVRLRPTPR